MKQLQKICSLLAMALLLYGCGEDPCERPQAKLPGEWQFERLLINGEDSSETFAKRHELDTKWEINLCETNPGKNDCAYCGGTLNIYNTYSDTIRKRQFVFNTFDKQRVILDNQYADRYKTEKDPRSIEGIGCLFSNCKPPMDSLFYEQYISYSVSDNNLNLSINHKNDSYAFYFIR
jgi:hypothetical protein